MKKFLLLSSLISFFSSMAHAIVDWEGVYKLENSLTIIRKPKEIQISMPGSRLTERRFFFRKGAFFNRSILPDDVLLSRDLDKIFFRREVAKLGNIIEATVNPPDDSISPVQPPDISKKAPPITKKVQSRAVKKAVQKKKRTSTAKKPLTRQATRSALKRKSSTRTIRQTKRAAKKRIAETKRQPVRVDKKTVRAKRQSTPRTERTLQRKSQPVSIPRKLTSVPRLSIYETRRMAPPRYRYTRQAK
ncbi:MAG: hypothetical protein K2P93_05335 [Alphaproteobacteria bacterium]|nr:hypothetical protein [Alphaproteobacteria bacterium]